jgi:hypothetical protein
MTLGSAYAGIDIDAQIDRQMRSGLAVIQSLAARGRLRQVVVVGLGTNGGVTSAQIRQLQRIIGPDRDLVLITTFDPKPWESEINAALAAAARHGKKVALADWHRAVAGRPYLLWPDDIHPRPPGAKLYARTVLTAIRADLSRSQPTPCRAPQGQ